IQATALLKADRVQRDRAATPDRRGERRTACRTCSVACSSESPQGGKGGLAPAAPRDPKPGDAEVEVAVQPLADGLLAVLPEQPQRGDAADGPAVGDLEKRRGALAGVGPGVVVARLLERGALLGAEGEGTGGCHRAPPLLRRFRTLIIPVTIRKPS